jgi:hypothetical protein
MLPEAIRRSSLCELSLPPRREGLVRLRCRT